MMLKIVFVAFMAVGVLAEYKILDSRMQRARNAIEELCKQNGAEDKVEDVLKGIEDFQECLPSIFDAETIMKEIEEAKPNGALDKIFKKYCKKTPQLKSCMQSMSNAMAPCLDEKFRNEVIPMTLNSTDKILDFVCYKDGVRIALFIAEGGPECFTEKRTGLHGCIDSQTLVQQWKHLSTVTTVEAAKALTEKEKCDKFGEMKVCVVNQLEGCSTPTPANMVESLLQFISKATPCKCKCIIPMIPSRDSKRPNNILV